MRYMIFVLLLLGGCGLMGGKDEPAEARSPDVSAHDRDLAKCEMQALERIPPGTDEEARIQRYTRLCMQSKGYAVDGDTNVNVKLRNRN